MSIKRCKICGKPFNAKSLFKNRICSDRCKEIGRIIKKGYDNSKGNPEHLFQNAIETR